MKTANDWSVSNWKSDKSSPFVETIRTRTKRSSNGRSWVSLSTKSSSNFTHSSQGMQRNTTTSGLPLDLASSIPFAKLL